MKRSIPWICLMLTIAGCGRPLHLVADRRATMEPAPSANVGPVMEMPLDYRASRKLDKVAVVDVDGLLLDQDQTGPYSVGENPVSLFREKLDTVAADPCVCAVVVRINSPGGGVTATDIMWRDLHAFKTKTKHPVITCLMDVGTAGGYYLATAGDSIIAHPTSVTGGIGVILNASNLRDTMGPFTPLGQTIKAGANIDMGTASAPLTPETRLMLQGMANEFHERFKEVVREARPKVDPRGGTTMDGRVFSAEQALERGLIDRIGYLDDAIAVAKELTCRQAVQVVLYHRLNDPVHTPYSVTPNVPLQSSIVPASAPGLDRSRLPSFLYLWQPEATLERLGGR